MNTASRVPVTLLTGFLGSGKTTLLNHLLAAPHGRRLAVIENEFGEAGVDAELLVRQPGEEIVEASNGCLCCTVRGDLRRILCELAADRREGRRRFDQVVVETTGLALPAPVIQTFLLEETVAADYRLDGVVTLVDGIHGAGQLARHPEAEQQVGFADRLVITKTDLAEPEQLDALAAALMDRNPAAPLYRVCLGSIGAELVLDVGGFEASAALKLHPGFPRYTQPAAHTQAVGSFVFRAEQPFDAERLEFFLRTITDWYGPDLLRIKGILHLKDQDCRTVLQGVHRERTLTPGTPWAADEPRASTVVFIGVRLPRETLEQGLEMCLAAPEQPSAPTNFAERSTP
ncbi:MAG: GTP-binding protein [Rhodocyclaceae bacterium]|nr:GTP-binding protein [Rhodocyclaceae bacterium]MCA3145927.1 GTP-binding protein [Rhodocyclaceae bacterium]